MGWEKKRYARGTNLFVLLRRTAVTLAVEATLHQKLGIWRLRRRNYGVFGIIQNLLIGFL